MPGGLITLIAIVGVLLLIAGLIVKYILDKSWSSAQITWTEYFIGSIVFIPLVLVVVGKIGWDMAYDNVVTYNEYYNGWELQAIEQVVACERDGNCVHEYQCDPYQVTVTESCNCDDDGCDTCTRTETRHHACPFATHEYQHLIISSIGDYTIDSHVFASNPVEWRAGSGIPANVQRGPSQFWLDAKARIDAGTPGPVTGRFDYPNYVLAADKSILKAYSDSIEEYKAAGCLPDPQHGIRDFYFADKVYFVGFQPGNPAEWQSFHAYLNSALGTEKQGDLHLVISQNPACNSNPDRYSTALKAYWQDPETWGKDSISKNAVIVVIGTDDGQFASWARGLTGMPIGNEDMGVQMRSFFRENEIPMTPQDVIGKVVGQFYQKVDEETGESKTKVIGIGDSGALRQLLWGLVYPESEFVRISMSGDDADDVGTGFSYLASQIEPTTGQKWGIVIIMFLLGLVVWWIFAIIGESRGGYSWRKTTYY